MAAVRSIRNLSKIALGSLTALAAAAAMLQAPAAQAGERLTPDQQLAKMLKDRVPGKPVDCINLTEIRGSTIIDKTAIVYDTGRTLYVNKPAFPQNLSSDDILVSKTWGSQLCRLDIVQLRDRGMPGFMHGSVGLESFVPYTKPPKDGGK